ncbi:MAG: hypothetical protein ACPIA2_00370 [Mariniblastus sp.]
MEENHTESRMPEAASSGDSELDIELKPWFHDLLDIRVIMFLVSTAVIAMTATVLLLSNDDEAGESNPSGQTRSVGVVPVGADEDLEERKASVVADEPAQEAGGIVEDSVSLDNGESGISKSTVRQESDGSLNLPIRSAKVAGCEAKSTGISAWSSSGEAKWDLAIEDRKTGYFRCFITYRSKYEGSLDICLGDRRPVTFYALPQDTDFTEQVMVRLGKPENSTLALIGKEIDPNSDLIITRVRLVPR